MTDLVERLREVLQANLASEDGPTKGSMSMLAVMPFPQFDRITDERKAAAEAIERLEGEKTELERRATFIEHEHPQKLEPHFSEAMGLLTTRKAFRKGEIAQLLAEQMERANDAGKRCSRVLMANEQLRARAQEAERELAEARAENERKDEALEAINKLHFPRSATMSDEEIVANLRSMAFEALAAPVPGECPECHKYAGKCPYCHRARPKPATEREAERPIAGQIWEHANGNKYVIVAMANIEPGKEDKFPLSVIYRNMLRDTLYVRRMSDWPGRMTLAAQQQALESDDES